MITKIYVENVRGFKKQLFEFGEMNFFIGDNSSGKSTLIKILSLVSNTLFYSDFELNRKDSRFGYFSEIVNKNSKSKRFNICYESRVLPRIDKPHYEIVWFDLEYSQYEDIPVLSRFRLCHKNYDVQITRKGNEISCKYRKQNQKKDFVKWVQDRTYTSRKVVLFNEDIQPRGFDVIFMYALREVSRQIESIGKLGFGINIIDGRSEFTHFGPIRSEPKRHYESFELSRTTKGDQMPIILRGILNDPDLRDENIRILNLFGRDSKLFDSIDVTNIGKHINSPFSINVNYDNLSLGIHNVGFGLSQIMPVIADILASRGELFSIEQPEVHLHPKAQAAFGSFIYKALTNHRNRFFIETHSDYIINRVRQEMQSDEKSKSDIRVFFFERDEEGTCSATTIKIEPSGNYAKPVPEEYLEFFLTEEFKNISL